MRVEIMKRFLVLLLSAMLSFVAYGQNNGDQSKYVYALVVSSGKTGDVTASIDFGDGSPKMYFADEKEKKRNFESNFEPINLLIKNGWEIDKFSSMVSSIYLITHWVMKKKVNEESEVKEGLKLIKK